MIVPTVWLPALPPVPIMSGMKSIRSGRRSWTPLKKCETYLVRVPARNRNSSQPIAPAHALDELALPVGFLVGLGVARDAAEGQDVFGLLLAEDVHGVVVGDDADQHVGGVDHGDGDQVVLVDLAGDRFLVFVDPGEDHVALHDVFDHGRPARQDQPLERDEADQPALVVDDVAVIDRFAVGGLVAEQLEGLADGDVRRQRDVVGRHGRAGGARLVAGQAADILALGLGQERKHRVDDVFVEPVDQVGTLVVRHQVEQLGGLLGRHRLDEPDLAVVVEVAEDLGAVAGGRIVEERVAILGLEVFDQLGDPAGVMLGEEVAQAGDLSVVDQLAEVGHQERMSHGPSPVDRRGLDRRADHVFADVGRRTSGTSIRPSAR